MGKRVFEVAKELGIDYRELITKCDELGINVRNYMSALRETDIRKLRASLNKGPPVERVQAPGVVRKGRALPVRSHQPSVLPEPDSDEPVRAHVLSRPEPRTAEPRIPSPAPAITAQQSAHRAPELPSRFGRLEASKPGGVVTSSATSQVENWLAGRDPEAGPATAAPITSAKDAEDELIDLLTQRGLNFEDDDPGPRWTVPRRFLGCVRAAQHVGALVLLSGTTGTGKSALVRNVGDILHGGGVAEIAVRPEWLQASDLLGYIDPIEQIFMPTEFVAALQRAGAIADGQDAPFLVLLDEMNLARIESYGADLLSRLELPADHPGRALDLYPESVNTRWKRELAELQEANDSERKARRATLESWLLADGRLHDAHRLSIPGNLCLVGTLNTDQHTHELSPKVLDRAFVLQRADPSVEETFALPRLQNIEAGRGSLRLPPRPSPFPALDDWDGLQRIRQSLTELLRHWSKFGFAPSRRLVRNARVYLAYAELDDEEFQDAMGDLLHLLLLPRVVLPADEAVAFCDELTKLITGWFDEDHPAMLEVQALQKRAARSNHGDVRGLR